MKTTKRPTKAEVVKALKDIVYLAESEVEALWALKDSDESERDAKRAERKVRRALRLLKRLPK